MSTSSILITGGGGFLGVGLAKLLLSQNPRTRLLLTDVTQHPRLTALRNQVEFVRADLAEPASCAALLRQDVSCVFHFASLVSGGAEKDFEAGLQANTLATLNLFEACRRQGQRPRFVFTSSIATFGGTSLPPTVDDWTHQHPQNSYGVAKVIGEQWLNDYSRKGYLDGRGVRLPAIVVRDEPNSAASGYVSALFREPLHGRDFVCPVEPNTQIPILSVQRCLQLLAALAALPEGVLGDFRTINGPNLAPTAGEIAAAVAQFRPEAGKITFAPQPGLQAMIDSWPRVMKADRAAALQLTADGSVQEILAHYAREIATT